MKAKLSFGDLVSFAISFGSASSDVVSLGADSLSSVSVSIMGGEKLKDLDTNLLCKIVQICLSGRVIEDYL